MRKAKVSDSGLDELETSKFTLATEDVRDWGNEEVCCVGVFLCLLGARVIEW